MKKNLSLGTYSSFAVRLFKFVPKPYRFSFGRFLMRLLKPAAKRFKLVTPPPFALDNFHDYLLSVFFMSLTYNEIEFEPKLVANQTRIDTTNGAIVVSGHYFLNFFVLRWFHDQGYVQSTVIRDVYEKQPVLGTRETIDVIKPDIKSFREIKKRLKAGEIVSICIDHNESFEGWVKIDIPDRQIFITQTVFKFAEKLNVPLIFVGTKLNSDDEIEIYTAQPVSKTTDKITLEFAGFLKSLLTKTEN